MAEEKDLKSKSTEGSSAKSAHTNKVLVITCLGIFIFFIIIIGIGLYLTTRENSTSPPKQNQNQSDSLTYSNTEGKFSVAYPKNYTKEEDPNGMGADFNNADSSIILRAFYVLSTGKTADEYLDGILQLSKNAMPLRTVTEIDSSAKNLGSLNGQMRVWKYETSNSSKAELRLAAVGGANMYNISLTCDYANYLANMAIINQMAASFKSSQ